MRVRKTFPPFLKFAVFSQGKFFNPKCLTSEIRKLPTTTMEGWIWIRKQMTNAWLSFISIGRTFMDSMNSFERQALLDLSGKKTLEVDREKLC